MADQIERLIAAVEDVARKITKLTTYKSFVFLGRVSTAVSSSVSGVLGFLNQTLAFVGTIASSTTVAGAMTVVPAGLMAGATGGTSSASGALSVTKTLAGSTSSVSGASGYFGNKTLLIVGSLGSSSGTSGFLGFMLSLVGSAGSTSTLSADSLNRVKLAGSVDAMTVTARGHLEV